MSLLRQSEESKMHNKVIKIFDCSDNPLDAESGIFDFCLKVVFVLLPNLTIECKIHKVINKIFDCLDNLLNVRIRDLNSSLNFYFSLATPLNAETLDFEIIHKNSSFVSLPRLYEKAGFLIFAF